MPAGRRLATVGGEASRRPEADRATSPGLLPATPPEPRPTAKREERHTMSQPNQRTGTEPGRQEVARYDPFSEFSRVTQRMAQLFEHQRPHFPPLLRRPAFPPLAAAPASH